MSESQYSARLDSQRYNNLSLGSLHERSSFMEDSKNKSLSISTSFQIRQSYDSPTFPKLHSLSNNKFHRLLDHFENEEVVRRKQEEEQEKQFTKNLETSFEMVYEDKQPKPLVGDIAVENYYKHYKNLRNVHDQNKLHGMRNVPIG